MRGNMHGYGQEMLVVTIDMALEQSDKVAARRHDSACDWNANPRPAFLVVTLQENPLTNFQLPRCGWEEIFGARTLGSIGRRSGLTVSRPWQLRRLCALVVQVALDFGALLRQLKLGF
jgi:hypothetical protein